MFHELAQSIVQFITHHPHLSLFIVFLVAFIESLPILGTLFPGSVTMTAIGTLLGSGVLPTGLTFLVAIVGAFMGDFLGYKVGLHYDDRLTKIWPFKNHPKWLVLGEEFFKKHGGKSLIIGRFIGPVRSTIPLIAGVMKVRLSVFLTAGISSAILWSFLYILPGFLLGALSVELPPGKASQFLLVGLASIIGTWFIFWSLQHFLKVINKYSDQMIKAVWDVLSEHTASKFLINCISSKSHPLDHTPLARLMSASILFLLFSVVAFNVAFNGPLTHWNEALFSLLQSFHTHDLSLFFASITLLGDSKVLLSTAAVLGLYLIVIKRSRTGIYFLLIASMSAGSIYVLKHVFHNPRPTGLTVVDPSFSFPSGHMLLSTSILSFLAFSIAHQYKRIWHWVPYTFTAIIILLIGLSRLFLGAHWLTDVVGSGLLSLCMLLVVIILYAHFEDQNTYLGKWWSTISLIVLLSFWSFYGYKEIETTVYNAQPVYPEVQLPIQEWWQAPEYYSSEYYLDRFGHPVAPFNVQWEGPIEEIKTTLLNAGWAPIEQKHRFHLRNLIQRVFNKNPEHHTPILTPLYRNTRPSLAMFKRIPNSETIVEFRMWQANVAFSNSDGILWLGVVDYHVPSRHLLDSPYKNFFIYHEDQDALNELLPAVKTWQSRVIQVQPTQHNKPLDHLNWQGSVLLVKAKPVTQN